MRFLLSCSIAALVIGYCGQSRSSSVTALNSETPSYPSVETNYRTSELDEGTRVEGSLLKAFSVAYDAFLKDPLISSDQKKIENYSVTFRESSQTYIVYFGAHFAPGEKPHPGGSTQLGKDVQFRISKKSFKIEERLFFK